MWMFKVEGNLKETHWDTRGICKHHGERLHIVQQSNSGLSCCETRSLTFVPLYHQLKLVKVEGRTCMAKSTQTSLGQVPSD